jgi:hypothetical protein
MPIAAMLIRIICLRFAHGHSALTRIRLTNRIKTWINCIGLGVWISGAAWLLVHYGLNPQDGNVLSVSPAEPWSLKVHGAFAFLAVWSGGLATSANYFSRQRNSTASVSALVNPRERVPYLGSHSVSVRAAHCIIADALTKVVLFAPSEIAEAVLASFDAQAYVI